MDRIRKCGHSNESYPAMVSCGTVYHAVLQLILIKPQADHPFEIKTQSVSLLLRMSFLFEHACSSKSNQIGHFRVSLKSDAKCNVFVMKISSFHSYETN